jgi:hypothetical protein
MTGGDDVPPPEKTGAEKEDASKFHAAMWDEPDHDGNADDERGDISTSKEEISAENDDAMIVDSDRRCRARLGRLRPRRPIVFLDIDGVLNTTKHNTHIRVEDGLVARLGAIVRETDALIVLTTFWRHFHEYIAYVLHRHGIDVGRHVLPPPMGATGGKQSTRTFSRHHRIRIRTTTREEMEEEEEERGEEDDAPPPRIVSSHEEDGGDGGQNMRRLGSCATTTRANEDRDGSMIGRSAEDEREYSSRAEEIEAWLMRYGNRYLGSGGYNGDGGPDDDDHDHDGARADDDDVGPKYRGYDYHPAYWRYVILDDRPRAAEPDTPLMDRFVRTDARVGLTEADAKRAVRLLLLGPYGE